MIRLGPWMTHASAATRGLRSSRAVSVGAVLALVCSLHTTPARAEDPAADEAKTDTSAATPVDSAAQDLQRTEERAPRAGTPLIQNKLYPMRFRLEVTGFFDYTLNDKYVHGIGGNLALGFHIFDWLAVEGFGGYLVSNETGIVKNVRSDGSSFKRVTADCNADVGCEPQLPDLWQPTWFAGADVQWAPIYGKLSAVSELDLSFQLYGLLGGGAEGITKQNATQGYFPAQIRPSINYGLGLRIIPWTYVAVRAELRNYNGLNPNVPEHDAADEGKCTSGYVLTSGREKQCYPDISQVTMLQVGVSFLW